MAALHAGRDPFVCQMVLPLRALPRYLQMSGITDRLDEMYVEIHIEWKYLYHAVNSTGCIVEFILSAEREMSNERTPYFASNQSLQRS